MIPFKALYGETLLHSQGLMQVLVQCENLGPTEATWEDYKDIKVNYTDFNFEDEVVYNAEGNV
jgi:hypothetical protein